MRAVILAAGKGERLGELTRRIPKPMIEFRGKPILQHNVELCRAHGIDDVIINLHHLPEVIMRHFGDGVRFDIRIRYSVEEPLLGTAGAVRRIADTYPVQHADSDDGWFILYGDNYMEFDLALLKRVSLQRDADFVMAVHARDDVTSSGVAVMDGDGRLMRFVEKPASGEGLGNLVNAGLYYLRPPVIASIPPGVSDFGRDIIPALLEAGMRVYGVSGDAVIKSFDTPEACRQTFESEFPR